MSDDIRLKNGCALPLASIPLEEWSRLRSRVLEKTAGGSHLAALFPFDRDGQTIILAVLTNPGEQDLSLAAARVGDSFASLTPECPAAHMFEREIAEQTGIVPQGHPWLKPVRFCGPGEGKKQAGLPHWFSGKAGPAVMDFYRVDGEQVHEVAVGPVHAGVIEPGHFRFQCHGEKVMHLEIALGFQHRGIEHALRGGPDRRTRPMLETVAGDTTCGHALAYAMAMEGLGNIDVHDQAQRIRSIGLELERIANHTGDLGALAGDVGFLPTASFCGRLRGDILNLTALLCGNRFGRGLILPGGVGQTIDATMAQTMRERLAVALRDIRGAVNLLFAKPSVLARFDDTGRVSTEAAQQLGLVGPAARACGLAMDVRLDMPFAAYTADSFTLPVGSNGDVTDRARMRQWEIDVSGKLLDEWLAEALEPPRAPTTLPPVKPDSLAVALTEGWRGRICHAAVTDANGQFRAYKVVDPSFFNWSGLAMALRGQQISDFPLCNKSFNLSYCGHDL